MSNDNSNYHLLWAVEEGKMKWLDLTLPKATDINCKDVMGRTPLHIACGAGHTEILKKLLAHGAQVNTRDSDGITALEVASFVGNTEIVRILLLGLNSEPQHERNHSRITSAGV